MQLLAHNQRVAVALMLYKKVLIISNASSERTSSFNNNSNSSRGNNNKSRLIKNWLGWLNQLQMWHLNFWSRISSMSERLYDLFYISYSVADPRSDLYIFILTRVFLQLTNICIFLWMRKRNKFRIYKKCQNCPSYMFNRWFS